MVISVPSFLSAICYVLPATTSVPDLRCFQKEGREQGTVTLIFSFLLPSFLLLFLLPSFSSSSFCVQMTALPDYFQISPDPDLKVRVETWLFRDFAPCIASNPGHYRGGNLGELEDSMENFFKRFKVEVPIVNRANDGVQVPPVMNPIVIAISCHGTPSSTGILGGTFIDKAVVWTPQRLWNGYREFRGLHAFCKLTDRPISIVFAQCYGAFFANEFQLVVDESTLNHVTVTGLSSETTWRIDYKGPTVSTGTMHFQLTKFMRQTFLNDADYVEPF